MPNDFAWVSECMTDCLNPMFFGAHYRRMGRWLQWRDCQQLRSKDKGRWRMRSAWLQSSSTRIWCGCWAAASIKMRNSLFTSSSATKASTKSSSVLHSDDHDPTVDIAFKVIQPFGLLSKIELFRSCKAARAKLGAQIQDHRRDRSGPSLSSRRFKVENHPSGSQSEQHLVRRRHEPQDLRFRPCKVV